MTPRRILLVCGAVSSVLYVTIDVLAAIFHGDYHSFTSQAISELMARGAPTERLVDPLFLVDNVLLVAFGVGAWWSAGQDRPLRVIAAMLMGVGALGFLGPTLFEMNLRGTAGVRGDLPHIVLTGVLGLLILLAIAFGMLLRARMFRLFSLATLATLLVSGALTGLEARHLAAGEPTPWLGLFERINIGGYLLWVLVLSISLVRATRTPGTRSTELPTVPEVRAAETAASFTTKSVLAHTSSH